MQMGQWVFKCNGCETRGQELDNCVLEYGSENWKMKAGRNEARRDDNQEKGEKEGGDLSDLYVNFSLLVGNVAWRSGGTMMGRDSKKMGCGA